MERTAHKQASKNRQQLLAFSKAIARLLEDIIATKTITKGTVYKQEKKCGNLNCKCTRGELHSTNVLSFSDEGRTHLIPLTKYSIFEFSKIKTQAQNYQQFRRTRAEIVRYFKLTISEINKLEQSLVVKVPPRKGENSGTGKRKREY
jgi:hypothetical protein